MQDDAAEASCFSDARVCKRIGEAGIYLCRETGLTDMQHVVVAAQAIYDRLLGRRSVLDDPVWFAIFGHRFCLRRAGDALRKAVTRALCTKVERR